MNDEHILSFDAQAENKAIIDLNYYFTKYYMSNEELRNALLRYTNNDTYKGDDATASKEYIATREIGFIDDTLKMQQKLMHLYIHKSETFAEKVDPEPYARIDTETLDEIQSDLRRLYYIFEGYDREFAAIADDLQERYGHICNFTKPNGKPVLESLAAICGGDNPESGSIYETKQAFIKWNEEECVYANSVMLSDDMVDFKWNLYEADEMLVDIKAAEYSLNVITLSRLTANKVGLDSCTQKNVSKIIFTKKSPKINGYKIKNINKTPRVTGPFKRNNGVIEYYRKGLKNYNEERKRAPGITLDELQQVPKDGLPDYTSEIDKWVENQNEEIKEAFDKGYIQGTYMFYNKVKTGGEMDIKQEAAWEKAFDSEFLGEDSCFLYHGMVMNASTLGNVLYAYVGANYYSDFMLYSGGAAVQVKRNDKWHLPTMYGLPFWGDAPEDHEAIALGIKWNKEGYGDDE